MDRWLPKKLHIPGLVLLGIAFFVLFAIEMTAGEGEINVAQSVQDDDDESLLNDCTFWAHIGKSATAGVNITIYDDRGFELANGTTDHNGEWKYKNMTNGDYNWTAEYDDKALEDNGTFDVAEGVRNVQTTALLGDGQGHNYHNDLRFTAFNNTGDDLDDEVECEVFWAENGTLYSRERTRMGDHEEYDLPRGNYTFFLSYNDDTFNTGWLHSYGGEGDDGGNGDTGEWFDGWEYETSITENGSSTIDINCDPDTEADEMDVTVYIHIYLEDNWHDSIQDDHTIYGQCFDRFIQSWTADKSGYYDFRVYLYDDDQNQEDLFTIDDVYLYGYENVPVDVINIAQLIMDGDDDSFLNDCGFWAHVKDGGLAGVNITIYDSRGEEVINGTTDSHGEWFHTNLTEGDYNWSAEYRKESLEDNGTFDVAVARNIQTQGFIQEMDEDDYHNDVYFFAYDNEEEGVEDIECEVFWAENGTLYSQGWTDNEGNHSKLDLPEGNYTFIISHMNNSFNSGWFHSYGFNGSTSESDEWFEEWEYESSDSGEDGEDDTIEIAYNPNTEADRMEIEVVIDIYYQDGPYHNLSESHTISGDDGGMFFQEWTTDRTGAYDFYVKLYDDEDNLEDEFSIEEVSLCKEGEGKKTYLEGYVTEEKTRRDEDDSVEGAQVKLEGGKDYSTRTNEDGYYYIECEEDDYTIEITHDGYEDYEDEVLVEEGANNYDAALTPRMETGRVYGEITDKKTGSAVENVKVTLKEKDESDEYTGFTAKNGSYSMEIPEGDYEITVEHNDYQTEESEVAVEEDGEHGKNFELVPKKRKLSGNVTAKGGGPIKDATVTVEEKMGRSVSTESTTTDTNGYYEIHLFPGNYTLTIEHDDYVGVEREITIEKGKDTNMDFELERKQILKDLRIYTDAPDELESGGAVDFNIMVVDADSENGVQDVDLTIQADDVDLDEDTGKTDADGRFTVNITVGMVDKDTEFTLNITAEQNGYETKHYEKTITIKASSTITNYGVELAGETEKEVKAGENTSYSLTIKNTGDAVDSFTIEVLGERDDWGSLEITELTLEKNEARTFIVDATIPENTPAGTYSLKIEATSHGDSAVKDTIILTVTVKGEEDSDDSPAFGIAFALLVTFMVVVVTRGRGKGL